jgi:acetylornithine deacetylase
MVELLERLVAFDTTSSRSNTALIDFVQPMLKGCGAKVRRVTDATGSKTAIHAVLGDPSAGGLAFSGHVDTVPVDGQRWSTDPFALRANDGRLHGRGAVDMKGVCGLLRSRGSGPCRDAAGSVYPLFHLV